MDTTLSGNLQWIMGGGGAVIGAVILSWIGERWSWYQKRSSTEKQWLMYVSSALVGLSAWAIVTYIPTETLVALEVPFKVIMLSLGGVGASQLAHGVRKTLE